MRSLSVLIDRVHHGWAVYLSNGVQLASFRGLFAKQRALRFASRSTGRVIVATRGRRPALRRRNPIF